MLVSVAAIGTLLLSPVPSEAACGTSGRTTTCDSNNPNPWTQAVGTGNGDDDRTVVVGSGATIHTRENNAISLGDNANITLKSNSSVITTSDTNSPGLNGGGENTIDFRNNSTLKVERNATVIAEGAGSINEAVNFFGSGNTIINGGLIHSERTRVIWSDYDTAPQNKIINEETGTISSGSGGSVIGGLGSFDFTNKGRVIGDISFGPNDDKLRLHPTSRITGAIDGGAGHDQVFLEGNQDASSDSAFNGFEELTKNGTGTWTLGGALNSLEKTMVRSGTLELTGDNSGSNGEIFVDENAFLAAGAKSLMQQIHNQGTVRLTQTDDGTYGGVISGAGKLVKEGTGTTTLTNVNTYSGETHIKEGRLSLAGTGSIEASELVEVDGTFNISAVDGTSSTIKRLTGGKAGRVALGDNNLVVSDAQDDTFHGTISGSGGLAIASGKQTLTGTNTYSGETKIGSSATLQIGDGGTSGSIKGDVANDGVLALNRSDNQTFAGRIHGSGDLRHLGSGRTTLTGRNSYSGQTSVESGTLAAGAANTLSAASDHQVSKGAALELADHDQSIKSLANAGLVDFGDAAGTTLDLREDYVGQEGTLRLSAVLSDDDSRTDRLRVNGDTSGRSYISVDNAGGEGALTKDGIKVVDVDGSSDGEFELLGNYRVGDRSLIGMGAFSYGLYKDGISTPKDGDWYLRSTYQPGAGLYQALPQLLQAMNGLPSLRQRVGNRYWSAAGNIMIEQGDGPGIAEAPPSPDLSDPASTLVDGQAVWGRIEGLTGTFRPDRSTSRAKYEQSLWKAQVGLDGQLYDTMGGVLIGSVTGHYAKGTADVSSPTGDGKIDTTGFGFGGALTWYGQQGFYLDSQAQVTWYDSDLESAVLGQTMASGVEGFGYALGIEAGQRFEFDAHWALTPQAQLTYSSVDFDDFVDIAPFRANVSLLDADSLLGRAGLQVDYQNSWQAANGTTSRLSFYGSGNLLLRVPQWHGSECRQRQEGDLRQRRRPHMGRRGARRLLQLVGRSVFPSR
ncbi:autotransporter outer membrane beta-barrel domain-containing protein [Chelativorans sp. M5D2P16]|nr:autotransporter outer membrane beta-barrel domain-containing protein [Chelativorans sp. M5D2P16]MDZ5698345.1 autotransporter outer membrane beta-barrel domain-containing protein [Chelativorans sp. M5D2P16]